MVKDDNQTPSWLEGKQDKELGLRERYVPPNVCLNISIWEQTVSAELATTKCLLENALIAVKEGRNVEAPNISTQLLRLRFSNGKGHFRARETRSAVEKTAPVEGNQSDDVSKFFKKKRKLISNSLIMLKAAKLLRSSYGDYPRQKTYFYSHILLIYCSLWVYHLPMP